MRVRIAGVLFVLLLAIMIAMPTRAGNVEPPRYFGPGPGYPDYGSATYFYKQYPPEKWNVYGYGTGHAGMGYGPYIYGGRRTEPTLEERPDLAMPMVKPKVKWIGGNEVRVAIPASPSSITQLKVDVLAFNGAVLESGTVVSAPYEIIAHLPEGATSIRVYTCLADGFSSVVFPVVPTK